MLHFFKRELFLTLRHGSEWIAMLALFTIMATVFVLALPAGERFTDNLSVGILWACALIVLGLAHQRMYARDLADGTLEQWAFLPISAEWLVLAKCLAHWLAMGLPLLLLTPLLWVMLGGEMDGDEPLSCLLPLALGTLALTFLGSLAAACTLRASGSAFLGLVLTLPLALPVIMFGTHASVHPDRDGLWLLLACLLLLAPLSCYLSGLLLRTCEG